MVRYRIALVAMLAIMAVPITALAGGWAMTSFDEVPGEFQAGYTYDLNYTVLQHGRTPADVGATQVRLIDSNGNVTAFDAAPTGDPGRYAVSITFPESGTWQWEVDQGDFGVFQIGSIEVAPAAIETTTFVAALRWLLPVALVLVVGLAAIQAATNALKPGRPIRAE